jgi:CRP-like cAMP-binding protein
MTEAPFDFSCLTRRGVPVQHFDAGEKVFLEEDAGDCMYVVQSGMVDVITFGSALESVGPGGMFGEMALIDGGPRSAAALASEATEAAMIDKAMFLQLVREEPGFALHIMRLLTDRIRRIGQSR